MINTLKRRLIVLLGCMFSTMYAFSQSVNYTWWEPYKNPFPVIEGILGNRLGNETGTYLKFNTNAADITIRYVLKKDLSLPAPKTLSLATGINLYAITHDGKWIAVPPTVATVGDTIVYQYNNLEIDKAYKGKDVECRLSLPLSRPVAWIAIGVPDKSMFIPQPLQRERPVVIIDNKQASDAWAAQLERILDRPFIHIKYAANIAQQKALIIANAAVYVIDSKQGSVIRQLQKAHPQTPLLLLQRSSLASQAGKMKLGAAKNIYQLSVADTSLQQYENAIRNILHQSVGAISTTIPVVQSRDGLYNWRKRHAEELALNKEKVPQNVIMANSIIHYWGGEPKGPLSRGADSWDQYLEPLGLRNMGFGWDKIENVLWRVQHDELDGFAARHVVLMIGTNNLAGNTDAEIITGLQNLFEAVKVRQPSAKIVLSGLLPRRNMEARIVQLNQLIRQLANQSGVKFINTGTLLLNAQGKIDESLFGDGLHPNAAGYQRIAPALAALLKD